MKSPQIAQDTRPPLSEVAFGDLEPSWFVRRINRFVAQIECQREMHLAHLANPGRLEELLTPKRRLWVRSVDNPNRKTKYDVVLAEIDHTLVSLDSQLPNHLIGRALINRTLPGLQDIREVNQEVTRGRSRIDFAVEDNRGVIWIEVKSVTLVTGDTARFPDAPTKRGTRHLRELREAVLDGERAELYFVIQREDAEAFAPNDRTDPDFAAALRKAADVGVGIHALRCRVKQRHIHLRTEVPVCLDAPIS